MRAPTRGAPATPTPARRGTPTPHPPRPPAQAQSVAPPPPRRHFARPRPVAILFPRRPSALLRPAPPGSQQTGRPHRTPRSRAGPGGARWPHSGPRHSPNPPYFGDAVPSMPRSEPPLLPHSRPLPAPHVGGRLPAFGTAETTQHFKASARRTRRLAGRRLIYSRSRTRPPHEYADLPSPRGGASDATKAPPLRLHLTGPHLVNIHEDRGEEAARTKPRRHLLPREGGAWSAALIGCERRACWPREPL